MSTPGATHIGVMGAGAWGTALAILANRAGSRATLWTRNDVVIESVRERRENAQYLPDQFIDPAIEITNDRHEVCRCDIVILAIPAQSIRTAAIALSDMLPAHVPIIIASKGIERGSLMLMSEVVGAILPHNPLAILSGPNFAREAAAGLPTATTLATTQADIVERLVFALAGSCFRLYHHDDIIATQLSGALKNVLAIAAGVVAGLRLGENARAALITRGMTEIARLVRAKGGNDKGLLGLSGIGDVTLSCTSPSSRNYAYGIALAQGQSGLRKSQMIEGIATAESAAQLAQKLGVSCPIIEATSQITLGTLPVEVAVEGLLARPFTREF